MIINKVDFLGAGSRWFESSRSDHLPKRKGIVRRKSDYPFLAWDGIAKSGVWQNFSENSRNYPIYIKIYSGT